MELNLLLIGLVLELLHHIPVLEDGVLQVVGEVVVDAQVMNFALLDQTQFELNICGRSRHQVHVVVGSDVEVRVGCFDSNLDVSALLRAPLPDVASFINSVRIGANVNVKVSSCNDSPQDPVVFGVKNEFGSLPEVSSDSELLNLVDGHIEVLSTVVNFVGNAELVASGISVIDVDANEVPARVAAAAVDCDKSELALTHIEGSK